MVRMSSKACNRCSLGMKKITLTLMNHATVKTNNVVTLRAMMEGLRGDKPR